MPENHEITGKESFDELNKLADQGKLTMNDMDRVLQEYAKSVREEFEIITKTDPNNFEEAARDFGRNHGGEALSNILFLAGKADSETVRLSASKYIVELGRKESTEEGDPIKKLLKELAEQPTES